MSVRRRRPAVPRRRAAVKGKFIRTSTGTAASTQPKSVMDLIPNPPPPPEKEGVNMHDVGGGLVRLGGMGLGGLVGSLGGPAGTLGGAALGLSAGDVVSRMFGLGAYKRASSSRRRVLSSLRTPSRYRGQGDYAPGDMPLVPGIATTFSNQLIRGSSQKPISVNGTKDLSGDVYVHHREFVQNVQAVYTNNTGGVIAPAAGGTPVQCSFTDVPLSINAGLTVSFPWLSQIAQNFTMYEFQGLIFEYRPTSGEFGNLTTNALGKVVMATQYDPDAAQFISSVQMENYDYATACKPSEHMLHGVECKVKQRGVNMLYTRTGPTTKDKVFTDLGLFQIAVEGVPFTLTTALCPNGSTLPIGATSLPVNIGELWVSYKVKLSRANLFGSYVASDVPTDSFYGYSNGSTIYGGTAAQLSLSAWSSRYSVPPASTYAASRLSNAIGGTLTSGSLGGLVYTFPVDLVTGLYKVRAIIAQAANGVASFSAPVVSNGAIVAPLGAITAYTGGSNILINATATTAAFSIEFFVSVNAPGTLLASIQMNFTGQVAGSTTLFDVVQYPAGFLP